MTRPGLIVGIGNRLVAGDDAGPRVIDHLRAAELPAGIEVLDGGLAGLDLAAPVERAARVVFVDSTCGLGPPGTIQTFTGSEAAARWPTTCFGHAAGLPYLLRALEVILKGEPPPIHVVGLETPATAETIERAAGLALALVAATATNPTHRRLDAAGSTSP